MIAATVMRIAFASVTVQLLQIVGIVLAGGVLLLWVCWKMYRELRDGGGGGNRHPCRIAPLGAECIEVGPVNASIHKVDEHVRVTDLEALPGLYQALVERLMLPVRGS